MTELGDITIVLGWVLGGALVVLFGVLSWVRIIKRQKLKLDALIEEKIQKIKEQKEKIEIQKGLVEVEKAKTDALLYNLFPKDVAEELKTKGKASPKHYSSASVLFTDIKGFTQIAEDFRPKELVKILDRYFTKFDEIIEKYRVEKIKTIGDSYMCASGLPVRNATHAVDIVMAGLEIRNYILKLKHEFISKGERYLDLKIGVHTGECVAGVAGKTRLAYDIWGNTVNVAHRMQETCSIEKINISGKTQALVEPFFEFTYRGKVPAKNKGELNMYYVDRIKAEFSADEAGNEPNSMFWEYVNLHFNSKIDFRNMERYVLNFLSNNLPDNLHYHGLHHTVAVEKAAELIALEEGIRGEELFLLKTAALLHDAGFTEQYANNEEIGAEIAAKILPNFGYTDAHIQTIQRLIIATSVPQKPSDLLEQILCDADLFYIGKKSFHDIADTLKQELLDREVVENDFEWDKIQVKFLTDHHYHTSYAKRISVEKKKIRIAEIKERIEAY